MGVLFNTTDTDDLDLLFVHRELSDPKPKRETLEIPLRDGTIELTEILSGTPRFENRTIKMEFEYLGARSTWPDKIGAIYELVHGQNMKITLPEDDDYYWQGICDVTTLKDETSSLRITIEADAQPFRRTKTKVSSGPHTISGETLVTITNAYMRGYPTFTVSTQMTVGYDGEEYTLTPNSGTAYGIEFQKGSNVLTFDGSGTVTVLYEGGSL